MSMQKTYKKGEVLFKDGDKISSLLFIQSGSVNQCLIRGKKNIDLFQLGSNQVLGETALIGQLSHPTSAIATTETKVVEFPADSLAQLYDAAPAPMKMLIKSLIERLKTAMNEVKSSKMSSDSSPCPEDLVAPTFASIYFSAKHKGETEKDGSTVCEWNFVKNYAQRVFGQSPKRFEQATNIFVKLGLAKYEMGKLPEDPDGPDVITKVQFQNINVIESFFEFYQYYFYKPGKGDILKYDESCTNMLDVFTHEGLKLTPDRFGVVSVDYNVIVNAMKEKLGITLNQTHFARLEQKGVMTKRRTIEGKGVFLEFEIKEYQNLLFSWKFIKEIDKWNEKGFVDINEKEEAKKKAGGPCCPQCSAGVNDQMKFCPECGAKLAGAAAA